MEYWPSVAFAQTSLNSACTATISHQFSPIYCHHAQLVRSYSTLVCSKATDYTTFLICFSLWWLRRDHKASLQGLADSRSPEKITGDWTSSTAVSSPIQHTAARKSIQYTATKTANKLLSDWASTTTSICLPWAVPVWKDLLIGYIHVHGVLFI